jgi:16S rRNA (guanine1516-N2)-methyltransferase
MLISMKPARFPRAPTLGGKASIAVLKPDPAAALMPAAYLVQSLDYPLVTSDVAKNYDLILAAAGEHLELRDNRNPRLKPVSVDFTHMDVRRYCPNLSRRQPLARAIGKKTRLVVDATAGFCRDALLLALMGFRVTALERSPVIAALAQDGLRRFTTHTGVTLTQCLQLVTGDARDLLPATVPRPETIYLDPMFPPKRKKSAAVKKELRLLRAIVGEDQDAVELFDISRRVALDRVVVKRPDDAPPLAPGPNLSLSGRLVRYDVYLTQR